MDEPIQIPEIPEITRKVIQEPVEIRRHAEELPNPSLPAFQHITPRPFGVEFEERKFRTAGGVSGGGGGAFFTMRTVESEAADNGDIYLQGGQVTAGSGTETVAEFLLYDASLDTWAGTSGQHLVLTMSGTGSEADDVLMPTFDLTSITGPAATTPPIGDNTLPTVGSLPGTCKVSLGIFTDAGFSPSLPGNIQASFCFGGFTVSRF